MRVLITGGLGLIGSEIARRYLEQDHQVVIVDNGSAGVVPIVNGAQMIYLDVRDARFHPVGGIDLVVHCASPVGPVGILPHRGRIVEGIVTGTRAAADMAMAHECPLVNFSTSEVYGFTGTYNEQDTCQVNPGYSARHEYAIGKLAAESMLGGLHSLGHLECVNLRPFNVTGPYQSARKGFVFPRFAEQVIEGRAITIYGSGQLRRTFQAVDDLARFVCDHLDRVPFQAQPINVGAPDNETSIADLAHGFLDAWEGISGRRGSLVYMDPRTEHGPAFTEADGDAKLPDITLASKSGWAPERDLASLIEWALTVKTAEVVAHG